MKRSNIADLCRSWNALDILYSLPHARELSFEENRTFMTDDIPTFEPLLDSEQAAVLIGINPKTLQRYARNGEVPALRIGKLWRFRKSDLDAWIRSKVTFFHHPCRK